ncbi:MAG: C40 family peptidase [Proteobacteria bacterium]|jgi:cell wall-associated NlpC family hydrolase|nr:C40 family peptidase [Pseudomonadota bacterium]
MRYPIASFLLGLSLLAPLSANAAVSGAQDNQADVTRSESVRGSAVLVRAIRSGPVFGLVAVTAFTSTRAARDPVPVLTPNELSNHAPIAVTVATSTLLNTATTTSNNAGKLQIEEASYAAARSSANTLGLGGLATVRHSPSASSVQKLLGEGLMYIGVPYRWGGSSPITGMDCSGLVQLVFRNSVGIDLPRTALEQSGQGNRVSVRELKPGDLVFFNTIGTNISHVGIYVGSGKFLHAPATGKLVRIDKLYNKFWAARYVTARRMINDAEGSTRLAAALANLPASTTSE